MSRYDLFTNPWEESERASKRPRLDISHLAKKFIKLFKLQKHKKKAVKRYSKGLFYFFL